MEPNDAAKQAKPLKLLVLSDSHGCVIELRKIFAAEPDADYAFFLGDGRRDLDQAMEQSKPAFPIFPVSGNCDAAYPAPQKGLVCCGDFRVFYTHGHHYGVKWDEDQLAQAALEEGADLALFGHTHRPALLLENSRDLPTLFNPGSVLNGSYGLVHLPAVRGEAAPAFCWKKVEP